MADSSLQRVCPAVLPLIFREIAPDAQTLALPRSVESETRR